jgi:hypothetical protein
MAKKVDLGPAVKAKAVPEHGDWCGDHPSKDKLNAKHVAGCGE